jgi:hypothetical protein
MDTRDSLPRGKSDWSMKLTTHLQLAPRLKIGGAVPPTLTSLHDTVPKKNVFESIMQVYRYPFGFK